MRARGFAVPALVSSAVLLFTAFIVSVGLPLHAQQPGSVVSTSPIPALPADVQAKLNELQAGLKAAQSKGDAKAEAKALNAIGDLYFGVSAYRQAEDSYNRARTQARAAKDAAQEAAALNGIGSCYRSQSQNDKALETYQRALDLATASGDLRGQATALNGIGWVQANLGRLQKAMEFQDRALPLARRANDTGLEATIRLRIGVLERALGSPERAMDTFNQVLPVFRAAGDRHGESGTLNNIGVSYYRQGEFQKALDYFSQALHVSLQIGDRDLEASALVQIGNIYGDQGEQQKSLDSYGQARTVYRAVGDVAGEARAVGDMGVVYRDLGEPKKSLDSFNQALQLIAEVGDRGFQAETLLNIGAVCYDMGEKQKAVAYWRRALPGLRQTSDRDGEAMALNNIGYVDYDLGEFAQALDSYNHALPLWTASGDRSGEALTLNNLGMVAHRLGEQQKALDYLNRALPICRQSGERGGEVRALSNIGDVYRDLGELQKALKSYNQALPLAAAMSNPLMEASVFHSLMLVQRTPHSPLAIFFGKQAVSLLQQMRVNMQGLDQQSQSSFLSSNGDYYHDLANLLIDQGRLPEAQQVLDLLKQQEYSDYVRGEAAKTLSPLALTPAEKQAEDDYVNSTRQIVSLGEQWSQLKNMASRTPEQEQQFQQLSEQLNLASKGLNDYYARLYMLFGENSDANKQVADVKGDVSLLKQTIARMPHTVALYTLVGGDRYGVIVITGSTAAAREYAITQKDLNQKVASFQQALRDPHSDAKPLAHELYKILVGPIKADLDQAQAQTLVWSLDGALRYVPMAALYDGKQYMVERYSTVTITPASIAHLSDKPDVSNLSVVAMGISRQYEEALPALPAVVAELDEIVKDAQVQGANGVLPGTILLNSAFTEKAMESQLGGQHNLVHIASHFVFRPGDDSQSYLLLAGKEEGGGGFHLTVGDFRDDQNLSLDSTDLLTLSACETGMSGSASNGREVDGLGTTAQLKGAKAVISSLWEVNDASTGALMADFYKRWVDGEGKVTKVEALRQAQLDLLQGKVSPQSGASGRGVDVVENKPGQQTRPAGYAHPYYWAPFVLMGNWR
ncbi:MAG: tetratricopeptide repeat protein [Terracidiphilus sp.]